jgi:predicted anti-sigma-YlaC factor YlaD
MTICDAMSDRMPSVAAGRPGWTAEELGHLETCADCRAEWTVMQATAELGVGAASRTSPEAVAAAVLERLRETEHGERRRATTRWAITWGGLAAAAAVMLAVLFREPTPATPEAAVGSVASEMAEVAFQLPLPELDDAASDELQAVLDGLEAPLGESSTLDGLLGEDVTQQDLERVLRAWEG